MNDLLKQKLKRYVNAKVNDFSLNLTEIKGGIVFLFAGWSNSIIQLNALLASLAHYNDIPLFVFDIDESVSFLDKHEIRSHGWGETYWIKDGTVICFLKKYDSQYMGNLVANNEMI